MAHLREIFAKNLKEKRRSFGYTQAKLAEMVDVSTHHIAMIELKRNFPTPDLIDRIAKSLNIEIYELFLVNPLSPQKELELLRKEIRNDMQQLLVDFFGDTSNDKCQKKSRQKNKE